MVLQVRMPTEAALREQSLLLLGCAPPPPKRGQFAK